MIHVGTRVAAACSLTDKHCRVHGDLARWREGQPLKTATPTAGMRESHVDATETEQVIAKQRPVVDPKTFFTAAYRALVR
jgi:hypothetical protein